MLRINSVDYRGSLCDGPGMRLVVFLQGCDRKCPGCHNPSTWNLDAGIEVDERSFVKEIKARSSLSRVTISGGEPLAQKEGLAALVQALHAEGYEDVALYTSYEYDDVPADLLPYLSYVKTGPYIEREKTTLGYFGSKNQQFIKLR